MALAVTCLLSLIPMKVPAMNPFWQQDSLQPLAMASLAASTDAIGADPSSLKRGTRLRAPKAHPMLSALDPLAPQPWNSGFEPEFRAACASVLYAGIRANPRIPAKRVRQIALPPPIPFNLRAPPARA